MLVQERPIRKILMTADTVGGVWTYALDLCRAYAQQGIQVCLATMGAPLSAGQQQEAAQLSNVDVRESRYKLEWMDDSWGDVEQAGHWLLSLEREVQPDIIHLNGYAHAALNWQAPVVAVAHSCVLSWWQGVLRCAAPAEWDAYKNCVAQGLKAADAVVAISQTYAAELQQLYGPIAHISVIYNGRNTGSFYTSDKKMQAFAMGRIWDEAKNLSLLGRIKNNAGLPVLVAGNNRHPEIGALVEIPNVQLLGTLSQTEVKAALAESYIYILPAKYEPFGLSVLEAAASGCLLVLADIPTLKELWQDTALYFNPDEPDSLDRVLDDVLQHPQECRQLIERSEVQAKRYSLDKMAGSYLELYQSLLPVSKLV